MSTDNTLINKIISKDYDAANSLLEAAVADIMKRKLHEMKKMCAAKMSEAKKSDCGCVAEEEKESDDKPKARPNLPAWGGKKSITQNPLRKKLTDREVAERMKKERDAAYDREDEEFR